jgi:signal transduction histidine kinase
VLIGVVVGLLVLGLFFAATIVVINDAFKKIELTQVERNDDRAVDALNNLTDTLRFKVTDWASWDDTWNYIENHNNAYVVSNLQDNSLQNLGINFMLFYNEHQQLVKSKGVASGTWTDTPVPQAFTDYFKPGSPLLAKDADSESKGLLALPDQTIQFVSLPILTSDGTGPLHGTLVFAYTLTQDSISKISSLTHLQVNYYRLNDPKRPIADIKKTLGDNPKSGAKGELIVSDKLIDGYEIMNDAFDKPSIVAKIEMPREVHAVAGDALRRFLVILFIITLLGLGVFVFLSLVISGKDHTIALKNEFFSIASHELRTPLTVIRDYSQLAKFQFSGRIKEPKFDEMMGNIDHVAAQLIDLVTVFLDAARLEAGKIPMKLEPFSFGDLVKSLLPEMGATAQKKNIAIVADVPANLPQVNADRARVQQVVLNLFGNAMKFTEQGSITIKAEVHEKYVVVYVTDTGRGLDEMAQKALFMRFSQVHTRDALHGSGLGLFISKKIVEQMGGQMKLESSVADIGTSLSFSLHIAGVTPDPAPAQEAEKAPAGPATGAAPAPTTLKTAEPMANPVITPAPPDATSAAPPTTDHPAGT